MKTAICKGELGVGPNKVIRPERDWTFARSWLYIEGSDGEAPPAMEMDMNLPNADYQVLSTMIAPALFMTATGSLIMSTNNRVSRIVDRFRVITGAVERIGAPDSTIDFPKLRLGFLTEELTDLRRRAGRIRMASALLYLAFASFVAAVGWAITAIAPTPFLVMLGLCLAMVGTMGMLPTFWAIPPGLLSRTTAAGGIALINPGANVGGAIAPNFTGFSRQYGKQIAASLELGPMPQFGLLALTATMLLGCAVALCVPRAK